MQNIITYLSIGRKIFQMFVAVVLSGQIFLIPPAHAQLSPPLPVEDRSRAVECLTLAIAYEAGHESPQGQQAVAEVVLNRVRNPAFPKSICDVVFAGSTRKTGCQFTFTCDGSLRRQLPGRILTAARLIAESAIEGHIQPLVAGATHYHADYVSPYWAPSLERLTKIGAHIFYRRPGGAYALPLPGTLPVATPSSPAPAPVPFMPWGLSPHPIAVPNAGQ